MAAKRAKKSKKKAKTKSRAAVKVRRVAKRNAKAAKRKKAKAPARKAKTKTPVRKATAVRKTKAKKAREDLQGEGNYTATREFDKAQSDFVKKNRARIPEMGKEAEAALEGPQGDELRKAEEEAKSHAHEQEAAE